MREKLVALIVVSTLASAGHAMAASLEAMQGAWTMEGTDCAETFKTVDGHVRFQDRGSTLNTGIIVSGSKIAGPNQSCTATRIHQQKNHITVSLSCADAVMFSDMSVSFKIIGNDRFERFDPVFSDVLVTYHRCSR
ncbi:hypothetical protein [Mesorhizobium sp. DCY119]|uniref:hypothetical protein n=1 Tax=Mesorhizobium sp. DCY119 TaxID=2108445 RepID=UPI000E734FB5|nr:hypothetical protein [Mesorhizobium sp. DCY119]RJG41411.1 hypothetical protein D3Y55_30100 [Mesorhizobium sp. DCY119]